MLPKDRLELVVGVGEELFIFAKMRFCAELGSA
jgi:hypothetical protein